MQTEMRMNDFSLKTNPGYMRYLLTAFSQTLSMIRKRKQAFLLGCVALAPVAVPAIAFVVVAVFSEVNPEVRNGHRMFVEMVENVYLKVMAPLMALFLGSMLVGEDVESQTIPHILTRPIPRSAWVGGKFLAYSIFATTLLVLPVVLAFTLCLSLEGLTLSRSSLELLFHYLAVMAMAVMSYGAVCTFLGALVKHPIVLGLVVIFGWQRIALLLPGVVDFLTVEKYVMALLPEVDGGRRKAAIDVVLMVLQKKEFLLDASKACLTLFAISLVMLALTTLVVRTREYTSASAVRG
jgi:ABC-2 type transport system permease protein